eukprot:Skav223248  [mRNA]  locus=scaffold2231:497011:514499:- [translate_table: standard]
MPGKLVQCLKVTQSAEAQKMTIQDARDLCPGAACLGALSTAVRGEAALLRESATDQTPTWKVATVTGMFPASIDVEKIMVAVQSCFDMQAPPSWTVTRVQDTWPAEPNTQAEEEELCGVVSRHGILQSFSDRRKTFARRTPREDDMEEAEEEYTDDEGPQDRF